MHTSCGSDQVNRRILENRAVNRIEPSDITVWMAQKDTEESSSQSNRAQRHYWWTAQTDAGNGPTLAKIKRLSSSLEQLQQVSPSCCALMTVGWHPKLAWKSRKINMQDKQTWPTAHLPSLSLSLSAMPRSTASTSLQQNWNVKQKSEQTKKY